jgi:hypothetical protein
MAPVKEVDQSQCSLEGRFWLDMLLRQGSRALSLPPSLLVHQAELEFLLGRVFAGRPHLPANVALAEQLSLNWCISKSRQIGIAFDEGALK